MDNENDVAQIVARQKALQVNARVLRAGIIMTGIGGALGFAGMTVSGLTFMSALRQWARQLDLSPQELARQRWQQAIAAGAAGADAWRKGSPTPASAH